jgi:imidazolonepropionase-like amidohydrolase
MKKLTPVFFVLFGLAIALSAPAAEAPQKKESPKSLAVTNARLIDGTGSAPLENATIIMTNRRFEAVGPKEKIQIPKNADIIDAKGRTVIPGLIDAHIHISNFAPSEYDTVTKNESLDGFRAAYRLHQMLMIGVTTVRDLLSPNQVSIMAKKAYNEGLFVGSRPIVCGEGITSTGGHGSEGSMIADGADEWRKAVREQLRRGADFIKLLPPYSREEVTAAIEETHAHQKFVSVHSGMFQAQYDFIRWAVDAGADCIEHAYALPDDVIKKMAEKKIYCVPTVSVLLLIAENARKTNPERPPLKQHLEGPEIFRKLHAAGVRMAVGTDAVRDNTLHYPDFYFDEVEFFAAHGYTPLETIVAATKTGSEVLFAADRYGTIEKGKFADLLILGADPLKDIKALRTSVQVIIQDGKVIRQ